jgi:lipopolysaccharide/colanic/teichoic acid biosynthesis glycosyltransferase
VGSDDASLEMARRIRSRFDSPYHLVGHVSVPGDGDGEGNPEVIGKLKDVIPLIGRYKVAEIIIVSSRMANEQIMQLIQLLSGTDVQVKLIPRGSEVVIGKSHITRMDDITMIALDSELNRPFNRFFKRVLDVLLSGVVLLVLFPVHLFAILAGRSEPKRIRYSLPDTGVREISVRVKPDGSITRWSLCRMIWTGKLSFVGEKFARRGDDTVRKYTQKPGLFSLAEVTVPQNEESMERVTLSYDNYYAQNYSLKMDIEIIVRALFRL